MVPGSGADMIDARTLDLIHGAIDGELDAAATAELELAMQSNSEIRALRDDLAGIASALQRMAPVVPPEDLDQRLAAALRDLVRSGKPDPQRELRASADGRKDGAGATHSNLLQGRSYPDHARRFRRRSASRMDPASRATSTSNNHAWGTKHMKSHKVVLLTGSLAVAIAAVIYFGMGYPPSNSEVSGTIAPAQRYRAATVTPADVQTGDQSVAKLMQTDTFTRLVNDASFRAFATNPQFVALARNPAFAALASNAQFQALARNADFAALARNADFRALAKNADFAALAKNADFMALARNADFRALANNADFMALSHDAAAFAAMAKDPQAFAALASDAQFMALAQNAQFQALAKNADFQALARDASFSAMLTNASFAAALNARQ